jgi:hypothetical protein
MPRDTPSPLTVVSAIGFPPWLSRHQGLMN